MLRLLFIRHGFSCANVPWKGCTTSAKQLSLSTLGEEQWLTTMSQLDQVMKDDLPESVGGIKPGFGFKPRGWRIPGKSKTADGLSDDCLVKARKKSLVNDQYDGEGNLIALRQLVRDPHLTACDIHKAAKARAVLEGWLRQEKITFDMVGSSTLLRAIETAHIVFMKNKRASARTEAVTLLPYINERSEGTPCQPENYPFPLSDQQQRMMDLLGDAPQINADLVEGEDVMGPVAHPRTAHQFDKFKVTLALDVLPWLLQNQTRRGWQPNAALVRRLKGSDLPERSTREQQLEDPLESLTVGAQRYLRQEDFQHAPSGLNQEYVIAIASHGNFLRSYCRTDRPYNLQVMEKKISVTIRTTQDGATEFLVAEDSQPCRQIMAAPPPPEPGTLVPSDLGAACDSPVNISLFTPLAPENGRWAWQRSACVASAKEMRVVAVPQHERLDFSGTPAVIIALLVVVSSFFSFRLVLRRR